MQEYLRQELERLATRPSLDEWLSRVQGRKQLVPRTISSGSVLELRDLDRT